MRILQFVDVPWDSGLAHYALSLSQGLKHKGHQVFVSAIPGQKPWMKAHRLGLKTVPLATLKGLQPLRAFLRKHSIDVLNAHTGSTHSLAVAAALGSSIAVVRTRSDARAVKSKIGTTFLYKHTHRVIAAADYIRQAFIDTLKLPPKKVETVYQGVALDDFHVKPMPQKTLGIVARLDPVKGHRYVLEAIALLRHSFPDLRVLIAGQEENVKQHELEVMAKRLGIEPMVEFMGFQKSVASVMARCSVGVIASTGSEAVSRVALEWLASGRPVVTTTVGCLPEMIQQDKTGLFVPPKDAPALAGALAELFQHASRITAMGDAARTYAEKHFSMKEFVAQTERIYKEAIHDA